MPPGIVHPLRTVVEIKPHFRGWLHLGILPLTLAGGIVMVVLSPTSTERAGSAIFVLSALLLFGVSALYHCGTWSPRHRHLLRQLDHCNIFVLIAGSCTAYVLLLLEAGDRAGVLIAVWSSALVGVAARLLWPSAPQWLSPPIYLLCGWGILAALPALLDGAARLDSGAGTTTLLLMTSGGVLYTTGGVVYGLKRPNPWPRWFGFHEVFHALTVLAFASHYTGIVVALTATAPH